MHLTHEGRILFVANLVFSEAWKYTCSVYKAPGNVIFAFSLRAPHLSTVICVVQPLHVQSQVSFHCQTPCFEFLLAVEAGAFGPGGNTAKTTGVISHCWLNDQDFARRI